MKKTLVISLAICFLFLITPFSPVFAQEPEGTENSSPTIEPSPIDIGEGDISSSVAYDAGSSECSTGHDCVSVSLNNPIDDTRPLELWVKFKDGHWEYSEDIHDLALIPNNQTVSMVVLKNRFGAAGFYVDDVGDFAHGEIILAPVLENGTQLKDPLAGVFFKLYVRKGETIYNNYITSRNLGYDYRDYFEIDTSDGWRLGWHIEEMTLQGDVFDVYLGIRMTEDSRRAKIEHRIIPRTRSYDDVGIEYQIGGNPQFDGTDLDFTKIRAWGDYDITEIVMDHETDIKTVPGWVAQAKLVTANDLVLHTFDFEDIASQGLSTTYYKIENMQLPDGSTDYVLRTLFTKGSEILQDELFEVDPGMSVGEATTTVSVESSGIYNVTMWGGSLITWYDLKADPDKSNDLIENWGLFGLRILKNGTGSYNNVEDDNVEITILENSGTRIIIKVDTYFSDNSNNYLIYNGQYVKEISYWTFYSDGRIFVERTVDNPVSATTDEDSFFDLRYTSWTQAIWGNESAYNKTAVTGTRLYQYTNHYVAMNYSESDFYIYTNSSGVWDYYDSDSTYGAVYHPSGTFVFSYKTAEPIGLWASDVGSTVTTTQKWVYHLAPDPIDDAGDTFDKLKRHCGDLVDPATISNLSGGSFVEFNETYGVYNFTSTATDYLNFTINAGSYPRNYTVFQVHNWTAYGTHLAVNDTTYTETGFLQYYNSTSDVLVVWLNSSLLGEIQNPTNISLADYGPPQIILVSPSNNSAVGDGATIDLNIIEVHLDKVWYNWDSGENSTLNDPWDVTVSGLTENENHTLNIYANDTLEYSTSKLYQFETDYTPPCINLNSPANDSFVDCGSETTIDLNVYDPNNHLDTVLYNWNGGTNTTLTDPYNISTTLYNGYYILYVYTSDTVDNWNSSVFVFKVDNQTPSIVLHFPDNGSVVEVGDTIALQISDGQLNEEGTEADSWIIYNTILTNETSNVRVGSYSLRAEAGKENSFGIIRSVSTQFLWRDFQYIEIWIYHPSGNFVHASHDLAFRFIKSYTAGSPNGKELYMYVNNDPVNTWTYHKFNKNDFTVEFGLDGGLSDSDTIIEIGIGVGWAYCSAGETAYFDGINVKFGMDNLDTVLYNWNGNTNATLSSPYDITVPDSLTEGMLHNLTVYANDTLGYNNSKFYQFDVENPPFIGLIGPLNGSSISILSTIILNVTDDTSVSTVLYNWDGGTNNTLTSPYYTYMPFDSFGHHLYVYSNDTYNNWNTNTFYLIGLAGAGATGGGGGGGGGEQEAFVVDIEYPVTFIVGDVVQITVKVNDTKGKQVYTASVIARYDGGVLVFEETVGGVYVVDITNYAHLGVNDFTVIVSKTGYATYEKRITLRGYESEAELPIIFFPANWMTDIWIYYGQTLITTIIIIIGITGVLYVANKKGLIELPQIGLRKFSLDFGIERRKISRPSLPSRKIEKALFADRAGVGMNWMVFAFASMGISVWMLSSLYTSPQAAGAIWFYAFSLAVPLIVVSLYISWKLGERTSYEPDELIFRSEDPLSAIIYGIIILVPVSMLLFTVGTYLATGINPFVMAPLHKQQIITFPWGALSGFLVNIFLQFIVAAGENIALLILPTLIFDVLGVESRKGQLILSASVFSAFHYFAAMRTVGIIFMFPYFFVGGCIFWLTTFGYGKFPQGGFVAGFAVHLIVNLMTISSASVLFV